MEEIWVDIDGYESKFQISNRGKIKRSEYISRNGKGFYVLKEKLKICSYNADGYKIVGLRGRLFLLHRLIAKAFIPNPNNYPCVNHKDENKLNNRYDNLEWCSEKYNNNFGKHNQNISNSLKGKAKSEDHILKIIESRNRFPVFQIDMKDGVILEEYRSMREAERSTGIFESNISQCCKGRTRSAGGFRWKYKNKTL